MAQAMPPIRSVAPAIAGLALARTGITTGNCGSCAGTNEGLLADGATLLVIAILALVLMAIMAAKRPLPEAVVRRASVALMVAEAALLALEAVLGATSGLQGSACLVLGAAAILAGSGATFFWLRIAKGMPSALAVTFVFGALAASELALWALSFLPPPASLALAALGSLGQLPCMGSALPHVAKAKAAEEGQAEPPTYFGMSRNRLKDAPFLVATAFGIGLMGIVCGLLRGYPDGLPIAFTPETRAACALVTIAASIALTTLAQRGSRFVMAITVWVLVQLMACAALVAYALFPDAWEIGAVFAASLNSLMLGVVCYTIIAFETNGWRDAAYYALAGWIVWLGSRSVARLALLLVYPFSLDNLVVTAAMGGLVVVSAQVLFVSSLRNVMLNAADDEAVAAEEARLAIAEAAAGAAGAVDPVPAADPPQPPAPPLARLMGLDAPQGAVSDRQAAMQRSIAQLGEQFLLSEREVEVLTLYAQGYTQKRVAEALFISQGTAHTHIKRIYTKTGMHSRQDILDYLEKYAS